MNSRKTQLASRNASTYNPISFNPDSNVNLADYEKLQKKEKQAAYRQQLDNQGVSRSNTQKVGERAPASNPADEYFQLAQREAEQKHAQQQQQQQNPGDQRRQDEEAYLQEQYRKMAEYERYQQQMDEMEKNYNKPSNAYQDAGEAYSNPAQEPRYQQHQEQQEHYPEVSRSRQQQRAHEESGAYQLQQHHPEANRSPQKGHEEVSTFQQQDNQREQLLNKIKGGYSHQNANVWSSYQRAHDAKEKDKRDFEQNLVNKAVQDRQREDVRAISEFDRKKRLQQEAADANRRAAEIKMLDKKKQRADDAALENQRNQDSLSQFERDRFYQKESQKKMRDEASRVLEQQVRESHARKQDKEQNVTLFKHPSRGGPEQQYYEESNAKNPLVPAHSRMNQAQPGGIHGDALDSLSRQMDKQLAMEGGYGREADYGNQGYQQNQYAQQQYGGEQKGAYEDYNPYAQQQYGGESRGQNRSQAAPQSRSDYGNVADYQKNRNKARNTGYNIITGELR